MKKTLYAIALLLNFLVFAIIALLAIRYYTNPFGWGWPSHVYRSVYFLLASDLAIFMGVIFIVRAKRVDIVKKCLFMAATLVIESCLFIIFFPRMPILEGPEVLANEQGFTITNFSLLSPCEQVKAFVEVASQSVNPWGYEPWVPSWMHDDLREIPPSVISTCIADEIDEQVAIIQSEKKFNEIAVRRIYALAMEVNYLRLFDQPEILVSIKTAACTTNADPFGNLLYLSIKDVPEYNYYSNEGRERLRNEVCGGGE